MIAFGGSIISSFHSLLFYHNYSSSSSSAYSWFYTGIREAMALGLLWYVLLRRGKSFADLGVKWSGLDVGWSILLRVGGYAAFEVVYFLLYHAGLTSESHHAASIRVGQLVFGSGIFETTLLFQFLNPFFEELIVRAYVMTEVRFLTNSAYKAIVISTLLQTSYHFYQGGAVAFAHAGTFLIFSIFYAKTNRITPVILAHLYMDLGSTLWYGIHHP